MGVGIDLEDAGALERFDDAALHRFLQRWFAAAEQSWCMAQPSLARAMVVGVCCKEAAYKAIGASELSPYEIQIHMAGEGSLTTASISGSNAVTRARLLWITAGSGILALAVDPGVHTSVLAQLLQSGRTEGGITRWWADPELPEPSGRPE